MFYNQIFEILRGFFFGSSIEPTSFEWLFTTGLSYACCLAVVAVPVVMVFTCIRMVTNWRS